MISSTMPLHAHGLTQPTFRFPHTGLPSVADDDDEPCDGPFDPRDRCDPCDPCEPCDPCDPCEEPENLPDFCRPPRPGRIDTRA